MVRTLQIGTHIDLSSLSYFLHKRGFPHKITEESGKQILWTINEEHARLVEELYRDWQSGKLELESVPEKPLSHWLPSLKVIPWKRCPVTLFILIVSLIVAIITQLGSNYESIAHFTFVGFRIKGDYLYLANLQYTMSHHEYWRFITPIFIHFGLLHLIFNALMLYVIGSRVEPLQGRLHLLGIIVITGLISNFTQYYSSDGQALFGGLSGVVYGLMGYCMLREKISKDFATYLPPALYGFMLLWLAIGYAGIFNSILGKVANAAHLGGLLSGLLLGLLSGLLFKPRKA